MSELFARGLRARVPAASAQVRAEDGKPPSLTATAHEQVVDLGTAADFDYCQANRKARVRMRSTNPWVGMRSSSLRKPLADVPV